MFRRQFNRLAMNSIQLTSTGEKIDPFLLQRNRLFRICDSSLSYPNHPISDSFPKFLTPNRTFTQTPILANTIKHEGILSLLRKHRYHMSSTWEVVEFGNCKSSAKSLALWGTCVLIIIGFAKWVGEQLGIYVSSDALLKDAISSLRNDIISMGVIIFEKLDAILAKLREDGTSQPSPEKNVELFEKILAELREIRKENERMRQEINNIKEENKVVNEEIKVIKEENMAIKEDVKGMKEIIEDIEASLEMRKDDSAITVVDENGHMNRSGFLGPVKWEIEGTKVTFKFR